MGFAGLRGVAGAAGRITGGAVGVPAGFPGGRGASEGVVDHAGGILFLGGPRRGSQVPERRKQYKYQQDKQSTTNI